MSLDNPFCLNFLQNVVSVWGHFPPICHTHIGIPLGNHKFEESQTNTILSILAEHFWSSTIGRRFQGGEVDETWKGRVSCVSMLTRRVIEDHQPAEETQHHQHKRDKHRMVKESPTSEKLWKFGWWFRFANPPTYKSARVDISYRSAGQGGYQVTFTRLRLPGYLWAVVTVSYYFLLSGTASQVTYGGLFVTLRGGREPVCKFNWSLKNGWMSDQPPTLRGAH